MSDDDFVGYKISQSNILSDLDSANAEYEETWRHMNESDNPNQTYVLSMVRAQKTAEVEAELRKVNFYFHQKYNVPVLIYREHIRN